MECLSRTGFAAPCDRMPQRDFRSVAHFLCRKKRIEKFRHVRLRHSPGDLAQGLLPPNLLKQAVVQYFIPERLKKPN
jgi:hypothetical protein